MEFGPGLGFASGYEILGCLLGNEGFNVGVTARAITGIGVIAGTYIGSNGACFALGSAYGLNVSMGLGILSIYE